MVESHIEPEPEPKPESKRRRESWDSTILTRVLLIIVVAPISLGLLLLEFLVSFLLVVTWAATSDGASAELRGRESTRVLFEVISWGQQWFNSGTLDLGGEVVNYSNDYRYAYEGNRQIMENRYRADMLAARDPVPSIARSLDRFVLSERVLAFNDPNRVSFLYLFLSDGTWLEVKLRGKLVSTTERLVPEAARDERSIPDERGVYGNSAPSRVGMSEIGSLFEISGFVQYILSEKRLTFPNLDKKLVEIEVDATAADLKTLNSRLESAGLGAVSP